MAHGYRPMRQDTVYALTKYAEGNLEAFGAALCDSPSPRLLVEDLQNNLSEGPIFEIAAARRIIRDTYASLHYQDDLNPNPNKVPVCVRVIADDILRAFYCPSWGNSYSFRPMTTNLENSKNWPNFFKALEYVICPSAEYNIEQNVYSYAAFFAIVVEGALEAAREIDINNKKHAEKVALAISAAFAIAQAILLGGVHVFGPAFAALLEVPKDAIFAYQGGRYREDLLIDWINGLSSEVCSEARRGGFVPGLPDPVPEENHEVMYEMTQERLHWGT
ncbi:hypothetical protein BGZ74_003552, partial [Mortierella antarctica]